MKNFEDENTGRVLLMNSFTILKIAFPEVYNFQQA